MEFSPLIQRLRTYRRDDLTGDLIAGLIVAIMLVPQAMAYAMLAGLPPQVGLYASIVPVLLYSLFGSSNALAVGPVAMVSLLVVSGVGELAEPGSETFIALCFTLALLIGVLQIAMALFRMGFLVNFISHPVLVGFTSAAAIVIAFSQVKHLLGISVSSSEYPWEMIAATAAGVTQSNLTTLTIGLISCGLLLWFKRSVAAGLERLGLSSVWALSLSKTGPLIAVIVMSISVWLAGLDASRNVAVVGEIPAGLPELTWPIFRWSVLQQLFPLALVITLVGYLESISVAKSLASRRREKVDPNRELLALGLADVGAAFTGGYPVTGGFSRSMVNFSAGARTPMASVITAVLVALSVALLTPLFFYVPKAVLAAIILVAVLGLVDFKTPLMLWKVCRQDAVALIVTFLAVLGLGIETGIVVGVAATILMMMWNISRPHVAEVGRLNGSEHFRNVKHFPVDTVDDLFAFRVDESLTFANAPFLENYLQEHVASRKELRTVLLICSGINDIDSTGIDVLATVVEEMRHAKIQFYLSDVKERVLQRLKLADFDADFLEHHIFLSAHEAVAAISSADPCQL